MLFQKDWITSKVVWASLLTIIMGAVGLFFGVQVNDATTVEGFAALFASAATILTGTGTLVFRLMSVAVLVPKAIEQVTDLKGKVEAQKTAGAPQAPPAS